jgi:segregation and condensation protein A
MIAVFTIQTQEFSGPLEKLVELIEAKQMDITHISLAAVTADFLAFVDTLRANIEQEEQALLSVEDMRLLADFLVVAARLILIKSKAVLPNVEMSKEEEASIHELEEQLQRYQRLKPLFATVQAYWSQQPQVFERGGTWQMPEVFYPSDQITKETLAAGVKKTLGMLQQVVGPQEKVARQKISLKETITQLSSLITTGRQAFSSWTKGKSKQESVVAFLALLHLLRDSMVVVQQDALFGEITLDAKPRA